MLSLRNWIHFPLFPFLFSLGTGCAMAQPYPVKPIRLIVPFAPGGTSDLMGRVIGARLGEALGQTVVVDNRGGAGGTIGAALTAQAVADGHTLLVPHVGLAINETLYAQRQYNAEKDLAPISRLGDTPNAVVVNNALPVNRRARMEFPASAIEPACPGSLPAAQPNVGQLQIGRASCRERVLLGV